MGADDFGLLFDPIFADHRTAPGHPERVERLRAIEEGLREAEVFSRSKPLGPRAATDAELARVHEPDYIRRLMQACANGAAIIDCADSSICPESERIARLGAGGVIDAALAVARGDLRRAFCVVRPPGHHAEAGESMGFCLYNNIALAARALQAEAGLERILILDWDVHHGNGTQHAFEREAGVLFVSIHGHPNYLYPHQGYERERGVGAGLGFTMNINLLPGAGDGEYIDAFETRIEPRVREFGPQAILISAGFDAHGDDPLGTSQLTDAGFEWMTETLIKWAERHCAGRLLSILEGGYDLGVLRRCVSRHAVQLAGR